MFAINPLPYYSHNRIGHRRKKFYRKYDRNYYGQSDRLNHDLRLIILRHAERIDVTLGDKWYDMVFGGAPSVPRSRFQHPYLPHRLPYRKNTLLYVFDPPITRLGEQSSVLLGRQLLRMAGNIDSCYSSPACRSVITANAVLNGMNRAYTPIRIEPYLFEPLSWNKPLHELDQIPPFMSTRDWTMAGFNIDRRYRRLGNYLHPLETDYDFYARSYEFFGSLEQKHNSRRSMPGMPSTILIVGHAATPVIYSMISAGEEFDSDSFRRQCSGISYLSTVVLERNATTRLWNIKPAMNFV